MSKTEQLSWEARAGKPAGLAAFLAIVLSVGAGIYVSSSLDSKPDADSARQFLEARDAQPEVFTTGATISGISFLLMIAVLVYLYRVTKYRRPELPAAVLPLAVLGPLLLAVAGMVLALDVNDIAGEFVSSGARTEARADDLLGDRSVLAQSLGLLGALALAFATVLTSQNAMRAGLLSRFLGILGIVVGVIYVLGTLFPLGTDLVQMFWLLALGLIFIDRWPGGRGPAWETGEATEWPTLAERREELVEAEERETVPPSAPAEAPSERTRTSRKRKKKKRR